MGMNVLGLSSDRLFMSLSEMPEKRMVEIISAPALESVEVGLEAQSEIHDLQSDDGNKVVPIVSTKERDGCLPAIRQLPRLCAICRRKAGRMERSIRRREVRGVS